MGIPCDGVSLRGWSGVSHWQPMTNQSRNRDFLVKSQDLIGVMNVVRVPVRATSGAISFITGTYHDRQNPQRIEIIYEAETHTM
jgi:hypothetical protein